MFVRIELSATTYMKSSMNTTLAEGNRHPMYRVRQSVWVTHKYIPMLLYSLTLVLFILPLGAQPLKLKKNNQKQSITNIDAKEIIWNTDHKSVQLRHSVELSQGPWIMSADQATLTLDDHHELNKIYAQGNISLESHTLVVSASNIVIDLDKEDIKVTGTVVIQWGHQSIKAKSAHLSWGKGTLRLMHVRAQIYLPTLPAIPLPQQTPNHG